MPLRESSSGSEKNIVITSQIVRDVKVGGGTMRQQLIKDTNRLRAGLRQKDYVPGDKVNCQYKPIGFAPDGALKVEIFGGPMQNSDLDNGLDAHILHPFHLELSESLTIAQVCSMSLEDLIVQYCPDVIVDDGGNAHNMFIDMALFNVAANLRSKCNFVVLSSSDPLKRLPDAVRDRLQNCLTYFRLPGVEDRIAVQFPWEHQNESGTFGLNSEPVDVSQSVVELLQNNKELMALVKLADSFIASDASYQELKKEGTVGRYMTIVNAATKYRAAIASLAYGTDMLLPMNYKEAADVAKVIRHFGREQELHSIKRRPLPSPLKTNGNEINDDALSELDEILQELTPYNPLRQRSSGLVSINYPITFEEQGGLVVGTSNRNSLVAFTSTPDEVVAARILEQYGDPSEMSHTGKIEPMGAGDAAAAIVAFLNTIEPAEFFENLYEGREKNNKNLSHVVETIFASALSRVTGVFMIHTLRTHLANIDLTKLRSLLDMVANETLKIARDCIYGLDGAQIKEMPSLGLKVVLWKLGSIHNPDADSFSS